MADAPPIIQELVTRFSDNSEQYRSDDYKEARVRTEFIDPFFEALGWDIANRQGSAEAYKEVIHEDALKIGSTTRAPDYCFRIGGMRKFFVEAKKPAVYIDGAQAGTAFQLRRYAWSAKLSLSILTNFDEFAVYDCRVRPRNTDPPATARILYVKYNEYAARWQEIASIFSHDAVRKGAFDRFAEATKGKRGTAEVDDAFLVEMETWRDWLAHDIAAHNSRLSQVELNFAVQAIINRIIFLRICEDRGIEPSQRLLILQAHKPVYQHLLVYFREADDRYNSGLFHFRKEKGRLAPDELTPRLAITDKTLKRIISELYFPESPYEFSVMPADILGQVYEQFLGRVIRLTAGHQARVEPKPEVKKAGGVFYTPTYIVDYIVAHTVRPLVDGKTPLDVAQLRILDPACGSGSFLIAVYQYLLDWHRDRYVDDGPEKHRKEVYQGASGAWRLTAHERKRILLNNIYGVDIDVQAVEVTKLSLLLKVLEGENEQTIGASFKMFHERALPDLANNIKCGNSLIDSDFYRTQEVSEEERGAANAFDWSEQFSDVMRAGGFHIVMGNPPYGAYLREREKRYLTENYVCQTYQLDSYLLFLERAVRHLLRASGLFGMIIPNPWLTNLLQGNVRRFITDNTRILQIVHFKFPVFPATVDTQIVILQASAPMDDGRAHVTIADSLDSFREVGARPIRRIVHQQQKWRDFNGGVINIFLSTAEEALARKLVSQGVPLGQLYAVNVGIKPYQAKKGHPPQTKAIVQSRPFDSDHRVSNLYRPCLRGSDIARYLIAPTESRFLKYGPWLAEPRPAIDFEAPIKIVLRQTGDCLVAALDTRRHLCLNNMHVIIPTDSSPDPLYTLGIINSELMTWYYRTLNPEAGEALAEVKKTNVAALPIKESSNDRDREHVVNAVQRMLELRKAAVRTPHEQERLKREIQATVREIDDRVYALYEITDAEREVVEATFAVLAKDH